MKCEDLLRILSDYVDGDIEPSVCEQFEHHLEHCDPCKVVVDTTRRAIRLYKGEDIYEIPVEFHRRLHRALRKKWKDLNEFPDENRNNSQRAQD